MEATDLYWKPIWHILEGRFELVLANAAHIRNVPGRKSDVFLGLYVHVCKMETLREPHPDARSRSHFNEPA
jgi:hypothetical protein